MSSREKMPTDYKALEPAERIIVALDCGREQAHALAAQLEGEVGWLKVGMTLFYREGPQIVQLFKERGFKVFVDLKLHDIPHQIQGAAQSVVECGADMFSIHASGGAAMMEAACAGGEAGYAALPPEQKGDKPLSVGITVLTSTDANTLASIGVEQSTQDQVKRLALLAQNAGLSGVVASPQEAAMLREVLGPEALIVTPGVRPAGAELGDQHRVATPAAALAAGASHLVIGRPITEAENPSEALHKIISEIKEGTL